MDWVVSTQLTKLPNFGPTTSIHQPKYLKQMIKLQGCYCTLSRKIRTNTKAGYEGKLVQLSRIPKKNMHWWWYGWWKKSRTSWGFQNSVVAITEFLPGQLVCQNSFMNKWHNFWVIPVLSVEGGQREPTAGYDVPFRSPKTTFKWSSVSISGWWPSQFHEKIKGVLFGGMMFSFPWISEENDSVCTPMGGSPLFVDGSRHKTLPEIRIS